MKRPMSNLISHRSAMLLALVAVLGLGGLGAVTKKKAKAKVAIPTTSSAKPAQSQPQSKATSEATPAVSPSVTSPEPASTVSSPTPTGETSAVATSPATPPSALAATVSPPSESGVMGSIKLQPSLSIKGDDYFVSENELTLGYKFDAKTQLSYTQSIFTHKPGSPDLNLRTDYGFLKLKYAPWWSNDSGTSLSHMPYVFMPTSPGKRDKGKILAVRNYIVLSQKLTDEISVSLFEIPIVHLYNRAGNGNVPEGANPLYENRVYLGAEASLLNRKLNLSLLIKESSQMVSSYAGAGNRWSHAVWLNPEVMYSITPNVAVGMSYESAYVGDSLMTPGLGGFQIADGLKDGIVRAAIEVSL